MEKTEELRVVIDVFDQQIKAAAVLLAGGKNKKKGSVAERGTGLQPFVFKIIFKL